MRRIFTALICGAFLALPGPAFAIYDPGQESYGSDSYITCDFYSYDGEWTILCWPY